MWINLTFLEKYKQYSQKYGSNYFWSVIIFKYWILFPLNNIFLKIGKILFSNAKIRNTIIIESHNDFDCNGGAIYYFLLKHNYNEKYKLIWLVKNKVIKKLPDNVKCFDFYQPSIKKTWYIATAKYLFSDNYVTNKMKQEQLSIYCTHGGCTIKNVKGIVVVPDDVDYILSSSNNFDPIMCDNYSIPYPNKRMLHFGFPSNDVFYTNCEDELRKITQKEYGHVILWMPTFRKIKDNINRIDGSFNQPLGIPIFTNKNELADLNKILSTLDCLLIIKIHPMQDPSTIRELSNQSNITVLSAEKTKELEVDNYRLMKHANALISDYSSATYSYLLLDRPIGFVLEDLDTYKRGLIVSNFKDYMPGQIINSLPEFISFCENVCHGIDCYSRERKKLLDWLYENKEGHSVEKLIDFLRI